MHGHRSDHDLRLQPRGIGHDRTLLLALDTRKEQLHKWVCIDCRRHVRIGSDRLGACGNVAGCAPLRQGLYTYRSGFLAAAQLLKGKERPTALFASNDDMAAGALAAAHRMKLDVPRDLSIVGFDDTPLATTIWPTLTTVRQPVNELTRLALDMLVEEISDQRRGKLPQLRQELVRLTLVERESVGAPLRKKTRKSSAHLGDRRARQRALHQGAD